MRRFILIAALLLTGCLGGFLSTVLVAGCLGGHQNLDVGSLCDSKNTCAADLVCLYGRCRPLCTYDRDCPEGQLCVTNSQGVSFCTLPEDDRRCDVICEGDQICIAGECVTPSDVSIDGDADVDADADVDDADDADLDVVDVIDAAPDVDDADPDVDDADDAELDAYDGSDADDGGSDAETTPFVGCLGEPCTVGSCCLTSEGTVPTCVSSDDACTDSDFLVKCDSPDDCDSEYCCAYGTWSDCAPDCSGGGGDPLSTIVCAVDDDCTDEMYPQCTSPEIISGQTYFNVCCESEASRWEDCRH